MKKRTIIELTDEEKKNCKVATSVLCELASQLDEEHFSIEKKLVTETMFLLNGILRGYPIEQ